ncbi:unnamed protein product [Camellia sinensis]
MFAANDQMLQYPSRPLMIERSWKSCNAAEIAPNCPRCASTNTKFCYYNNYSFSQPRYFCKGCRRYWTRGGSLRDVPVGGGCRKTRRAKVVRSLQNQRPTTVTSESDPPPPVALSCRSGGGGSDIDLAEVFAKFLNQNNPTREDDRNQQNQQLTQDVVVNQQKEQLSQEFGVGGELGSVGLQTMVSDLELNQGLLQWCDDQTILPGFEWQPMVDLQEFGSFSSDDDQPEISANLISNNWSMFDLSEYI